LDRQELTKSLMECLYKDEKEGEKEWVNDNRKRSKGYSRLALSPRALVV
jgi:hypothetical protein